MVNDPLAADYIPPRLLLQWHITERCNLRCTHCYQTSYARDELDTPGLFAILDQYLELLDRWRGCDPTVARRGHINVTGGEPFVRRDFSDLLEAFTGHSTDIGFAILTNGTFIDCATANRLAELEPEFVQVSIEGSEATHDRIRGNGNHEATATAIRHLVNAGVPVVISFTAHRDNYKEFAEVARMGEKLGVTRVWADRLIPWGAGSDLALMTETETHEFFNIMRSARKRAKRAPFGRTDVGMYRALQFLASDCTPYHCTAGDTLITVQPNGDLYPCRRMPIKVGNLTETPLTELYYSSELFRRLRDPTTVSTGCQGCPHALVCRGGLRCLSYALTGDPFVADPQCWLAEHATHSHTPPAATAHVGDPALT